MAPLTLSELVTRTQDYASDCSDALAQSKSLHFQDNILSYSEANGLFGSVSDKKSLSDWAWSQIAQRLDAPSLTWLRQDSHCPEPLRSELMNKLVDLRDDDRLLIRSKGQTARAILSDEYTVFDNTELVDLVATATESLGTEVQVMRPQIEDELRAHIVLPKITFAPDPRFPNDGGLHPGIYISNSERGLGKARITGGTFRSICSNGMIYGWNNEDMFAIRHRWVQKSAMVILVATAIANALKLSEEAAKKFLASQEKHLKPVDLKGIVDGWSTKYGLTIEANENWLSAITNEAVTNGRQNDPRLFDVVNAATFVAQSRGADEREQMERLSGDMLYHYAPSFMDQVE